jgi:hypothetical protein
MSLNNLVRRYVMVSRLSLDYSLAPSLVSHTLIQVEHATFAPKMDANTGLFWLQRYRLPKFSCKVKTIEAQPPRSGMPVHKVPDAAGKLQPIDRSRKS